MKTVNDAIKGRFQGSRCDPTDDFFDGWPDDFHVSWKMGYASEDLFSGEVSEEWECGAPYPSTEPRSFTYDLRTGKEVAFADLFQDYEKDGDSILGTLFADGVAYGSEDCREMVATWPNPGEEPGARPPNGLKFVTGKFLFPLTPTALHVYEVDLVHVIAGCAARAEVPYETGVASDRRATVRPPGEPPDELEEEFLEEVTLPDSAAVRAFWQEARPSFAKGTAGAAGPTCRPAVRPSSSTRSTWSPGGRSACAAGSRGPGREPPPGSGASPRTGTDAPPAVSPVTAR